MKAAPAIYFMLLIHLTAVVIAMTEMKRQPASRIDVEKELDRISSLCLKKEDRLELVGNVRMSKAVFSLLMAYAKNASIEVLALQEVRSILQFSPPGPWKPYNETSPSEQELDESPTLEAYYEIKEPRNLKRASDNIWVLEENVDDIIRYLDKHQPTIRGIFKQTFQERLVKEGSTINRKTVDAMLQEFENIKTIVYEAVRRMFYMDNCWLSKKQKMNDSSE